MFPLAVNYAPVAPQMSTSVVSTGDQQESDGPFLSPGERKAMAEALAIGPEGNGAPGGVSTTGALSVFPGGA